MKTERVFLIGLRGTGKSTLGRAFADRNQCPFYDMDLFIEARSGMSIRTIFASEGESGFRQREHEALKRLCTMTPAVIATGGGVILQEDNRTMLHTQGWTVWLSATPDTCWRRMNQDANSMDRRPALLEDVSDGLIEMKQILAQREAWYRECADFELSTESADKEAILEVLQSAYHQAKEQAE